MYLEWALAERPLCAVSPSLVPWCSDNNIGPEGARHLAAALKENKTLVGVSLVGMPHKLHSVGAAMFIYIFFFPNSFPCSLTYFCALFRFIFSQLLFPFCDNINAVRRILSLCIFNIIWCREHVAGS